MRAHRKFQTKPYIPQENTPANINCDIYNIILELGLSYFTRGPRMRILKECARIYKCACILLSSVYPKIGISMYSMAMVLDS